MKHPRWALVAAFVVGCCAAAVIWPTLERAGVRQADWSLLGVGQSGRFALLQVNGAMGPCDVPMPESDLVDDGEIRIRVRVRPRECGDRTDIRSGAVVAVPLPVSTKLDGEALTGDGSHYKGTQAVVGSPSVPFRGRGTAPTLWVVRLVGLRYDVARDLLVRNGYPPPITKGAPKSAAAVVFDDGGPITLPAPANANVTLRLSRQPRG